MIPLLVLSFALLFPIEAKSQPSGGGVTTMAQEENSVLDAKVAEAVGGLKELGIVTDPEYWLEKNAGGFWQNKAVEGKYCNGRFVGIILVQIAKIL